MAYKVRFVDPAKNYRMIKDEIDAAYFEVMSKGDLIDRGQLKTLRREPGRLRGDEIRRRPEQRLRRPAHVAAGGGHRAGRRGHRPGPHLRGHLLRRSSTSGPRRSWSTWGRTSTSTATRSRRRHPADPRHHARPPERLHGRHGAGHGDRRKARSRRRRGRLPEPGGQHARASRAGAWGLTGCWSFYPFKILGGYGDGGAITTDDPEVALFARRMRYNGEDRETGEYHGHGFTCLLDNLQAAFLDVKLRHLPRWIVQTEGHRRALPGGPLATSRTCCCRTTTIRAGPRLPELRGPVQAGERVSPNT